MSEQLPENILNAIVRELTGLRKQKGLSHEKLAEKTGVHRSTISLIESGKRSPTLVTCLKLARGLDIRLTELLDKIEP